ncbi:MAG: hypothetical protein GF405_03450 [Candidatus Eisenbacteria bacterium]|nr:hypothetical protein [Candidatus Eisenbacteria bacterium]
MRRCYCTLTLLLLLALPLTTVAQYPERTSPENVLAKLEQAYEAMDAAAYLDCLAPGFVFHLASSDWQSDPGLPEYWGFSEESAVHGNMFHPSSIVEHVTVSLNVLSWSHDPGTDPGDPSDDRWISFAESVVWFHCQSDIVYLASSAQEFTLRVDPDDQGAGGETLYDIIEWSEIEFLASGRESTTWGCVKAMFYSETPVDGTNWTRIKALYR